MITLVPFLFIIGFVALSLESLGVATAFFGAVVLILRFGS
jgi:hypothetical protein